MLEKPEHHALCCVILSLVGEEGNMNKPYERPKHRSDLRLKLGAFYFGLRRKLSWIFMRNEFATTIDRETLPYTYFSHHTPLIRKLKDTEMWMQENKIVNLKIAVECLNGVIIRPGETFSYWKLIGNPTRRRGFKEGMVLVNGTVRPGIGGGLCQLSNLIFWMTIHTPLTVVERHRHAYDVFPDTYQLVVKVGETDLEGSWRLSSEPLYRYEIVEKDHEMRSEFWGGFTRHNKLYREQYDTDGNLLSEQLVIENSAVMMYSPFLEQTAKS